MFTVGPPGSRKVVKRAALKVMKMEKNLTVINKNVLWPLVGSLNGLVISGDLCLTFISAIITFYLMKIERLR